MATLLELVSVSPEETRAVGEAVGRLLRGGDVVSLAGDLGAGKTTFVQGAARGLDVTQPVLSPTFTLVREYAGRVPVFHVDVYRLDHVQDVLDLGFDEMLDAGGVMFVEWGDVIGSLLPDAFLEVWIELRAGEEDRAVRMVGHGASWAARWERLDAGVAGATARRAG